MHTEQQAPQKTLSNDPRRAMQEMMDTIDVMRSVYERETETLEKLDTKGFLSIQDEKLRTANIYKARIEEILLRKNEMRGVDPSMKKKLERTQEQFAELASKNMAALKRMQRTTERLGGTIQKIAKDSVNKQNTFSYGETGHMHKNEKKRVSIGVSETA